MAERNAEVVWNNQSELAYNQPRNDKPLLSGVEVTNDTLTPAQRKGEGYYVYDFGGIGEVESLQWEGDGFVSFRYKVADTREGLNTTEFVGSSTDKFVGTALDIVKWNALPGPYIVIQNNGLQFSGTTDDTQGVFQQVATVETNDIMEGPLALEVRMKLSKLTESSGAQVYLGLTDGTNTILLRKFYQQLKASSPNSTTEVNTNKGNATTIVVTRNATIIFTDTDSKLLTDGILEKIDYADIPTGTIDTLVNLKRYAHIPSIQATPKAFGETLEAIPFKVRSPYNPTQTPTGFKPPIHYDIKRDAGFYRATVPVVQNRVDLYESQITSWSWDSAKRKWILSDTNNVWKIALTLPPGVYRYNFWADGKEVPDTTNPNSYYLDENNNKVSIFRDGYGYGYGYGESPGVYIPEGAPFFSELKLRETRTIEFLYQGFAKQAAVVGTFNDYDPTKHLMEQTVDRNLIRRLADPFFLYTNDSVDYHKIEIVLPYRTSIDTIDFATLVPKSHKQRVKIFLDDVPVSRLDWNLVPGTFRVENALTGEGEGKELPMYIVYGYGYGVPMSAYGVHYGYSAGYGVDYGYGTCPTETGYGSGLEQVCELAEGARCNLLADLTSTFSYWDNNTDTITASEDIIVRWCLKDGQTRTAQKITFLTRIEAAQYKTRRHVSLDFFCASKQAHTVTDYGFSDSYSLVQETHSTYATQLQQWALPIAGLHKGLNEITPIAYDNNGNPIFGDPIIVKVEKEKPSVWEINRSAWASSSAEVIYGVASRLRFAPIKVFAATDDRSLNTVPITQPAERFDDLKVKKIVDFINVQVAPSIPLYVKMIGLYNTFELAFYESQADVDKDINRLGTITAANYGVMYPQDFSGPPAADGRANFFALDKYVSILGRETQVTVGNIVATYQRGGADKIIRVEQVR